LIWSIWYFPSGRSVGKFRSITEWPFPNTLLVRKDSFQLGLSLQPCVMSRFTFLNNTRSFLWKT
jgi:hypothetical protein